MKTAPVPIPLCVTRVGFAAMLDVSVRTVDRMIAAGEIPVRRVRGKTVRILRSDAERYLAGENLKPESPCRTGQQPKAEGPRRDAEGTEGAEGANGGAAAPPYQGGRPAVRSYLKQFRA